MNSLERFLDAYIQCALWSSTDEGGEPLDGNYGPSDLAHETRKIMRKDCASFLRQHEGLIEGRIEDAGHDFWLTRCGHGCGFWDGDWPEHGEALTEAAEEFVEVNLYAEYGLIYQYETESIRYYLEPNGDYLCVFMRQWTHHREFTYDARGAAIAGQLGSVQNTSASETFLSGCREIACKDVPDQWFKAFHGEQTCVS